MFLFKMPFQEPFKETITRPHTFFIHWLVIDKLCHGNRWRDTEATANSKQNNECGVLQATVHIPTHKQLLILVLLVHVQHNHY